jgi:hypothetical protein
MSPPVSDAQPHRPNTSRWPSGSAAVPIRRRTGLCRRRPGSLVQRTPAKNKELRKDLRNPAGGHQNVTGTRKLPERGGDVEVRLYGGVAFARMQGTNTFNIFKILILAPALAGLRWGRLGERRDRRRGSGKTDGGPRTAEGRRGSNCSGRTLRTRAPGNPTAPPDPSDPTPRRRLAPLSVVVWPRSVCTRTPVFVGAARHRLSKSL